MSIVFKGKNNEVAIMTLVNGADKNEAVKKFLELHSDFVEVEGEISLPDNRQHRDAWVLKGNKIVVDKQKALKIDQERKEQLENTLEARLQKLEGKIT